VQNPSGAIGIISQPGGPVKTEKIIKFYQIYLIYPILSPVDGLLFVLRYL